MAAKPLTDAEILAKVPQGMDAVVIVKNATGLDDKVVEFLGTFIPKDEAPPVERMKPMANILEGLLDNPSAIKPGSPFLFVVKFKETLQEEPRMAILLDLADFKAFVGEAKPDAQGVYEIDSGVCVPYQGLVMFAEDAEELAALAKTPAGIKLSAPQTALLTGNDVYAHIDLAALMKAAAPLYEEEHQRLVERHPPDLGLVDQAPRDPLPAIVEHHERLDGSGYPFGLHGDQMSRMGRIVAVADVYDALTTDRPYRKAMGLNAVIEFMKQNSGDRFDPECVDALTVIAGRKDGPLLTE